jgi:hypothetical protein
VPVRRTHDHFDETVLAWPPPAHDTTLGHEPPDLDATILAPLPASTREPSGIHRRSNPDATMLASLPGGDTTVSPGDATFVAALSHLAGVAQPSNEQVRPGPGARLVANAELTVTDATPDCAALLGLAGEELIGDSLTDVFLRGVRRAYADPQSTVTLSITRDARGSIAVTFTLANNGGPDR